MKEHGSTLTAAAILLGAVATTSLITTPASAYQCASSGHSATGYGNTRSAALARSRYLWSSLSKDRLGQAWSVWNIAKSRSTRCKRTHSKPSANWSCKRRAVPCLYVVQ